MKKSTLAMLALMTALSAATMSFTVYADTPCNTCGCNSNKSTEENSVHREPIDASAGTKDSVKEQQQ